MNKNLITFLLLLLVLAGCMKKYESFYEPPANLGSDLYTTLATDTSGNFTTLVKAIDLVPSLKSEISSSGLYTVFAPTNKAFDQFFSSNAEGYKQLKDIPVEKLEIMLRYHVLKWMLFNYNFSNPIVASNYQYETRAAVSVKDMSASRNGKQLYYDNKWIQIYNQKYFPNNQLQLSDYTDVFGSSASFNQYFNVMEASPVKVDIRSANGVIHTINVVLDVPRTIAQHLEKSKDADGGYFNALRSKLMYYYYDDKLTRKQINSGDANNDGMLDSLFRRKFFSENGLALQLLDDDYITTITNNVVTQSALTMFTPDANSFNSYYNTKLLPSFYNKSDSIPFLTWWLLYKSHISYGLNWPSKAYSGKTSNDIGDKISLSKNEVKSVKMLSNGLIYQINKVIEPKMFTGTLGPAFFDNMFTYEAWMINKTNYQQYLDNTPGQNYTFMGLSNTTLQKSVHNLNYQDRMISVDGTALVIPYLFKPTVTPSGLITLTQFPTATYLSLLQAQTLRGSYTYSQLTDGFYQTYFGYYVKIQNHIIYSGNTTVNNLTEGQYIKYFSSNLSPVNTKVPPAKGSFLQADSIINMPGPIYNSILNRPEYSGFALLVSKAGLSAAVANNLEFQGITASEKRTFTLFIPSNFAIDSVQTKGTKPFAWTTPATIAAADLPRLQQWIRHCFVYQDADLVAENQLFTNGQNVNGSAKYYTRKQSGTGEQPITIKFDPVNQRLILTDSNGMNAQTVSEVTSIFPQPVQPVSPLPNLVTITPQNVLCKDGVIQIINKVFKQY